MSDLNLVGRVGEVTVFGPEYWFGLGAGGLVAHGFAGGRQFGSCGGVGAPALCCCAVWPVFGLVGGLGGPMAWPGGGGRPGCPIAGPGLVVEVLLVAILCHGLVFGTYLVVVLFAVPFDLVAFLLELPFDLVVYRFEFPFDLVAYHVGLPFDVVVHLLVVPFDLVACPLVDHDLDVEVAMEYLDLVVVVEVEGVGIEVDPVVVVHCSTAFHQRCSALNDPVERPL